MANVLARIRKDVFGLTQRELAIVAGTRQATVSRWETGALEPSRDQIQAILNKAAELGLSLSASDFFDLSADYIESISPSSSPSNQSGTPA